MDLQLTDKVAIVTGSSKGLGFASARALAAEGCRVTLCARGETRLHDAGLELTKLSGAPGKVLTVAADLSTEQAVAEVVARTVATCGGLDIRINSVRLAKGAGIVGTSD